MAKRSDTRRKRSVVRLSEELETVNLQLRINATVKIVGSATGKEYVFRGAGSIVPVHPSDAPEMLKKVQNPCRGCGSGLKNNWFQEV